MAAEKKAREILVMWLRLTEGVNLVEFESLAGTTVDELCGPVVEGLIEEGLLLRMENRLALTEDALFVSNSVFTELV